jgi:Tfp pilus assembly protein PilP
VPPRQKATQEEDEEYRKNPDRPTKTTGTLADRFPKRKVIEYQSWGRRDPFSQLVDRSRAGYMPGEIPNVETLRLVGVLKAPDGSAALLEDYEGYGYILKDGDQVKNGYVVQIGQDKIIFQIKEYGWSRTIALRLETE